MNPLYIHVCRKKIEGGEGTKTTSMFVSHSITFKFILAKRKGGPPSPTPLKIEFINDLILTLYMTSIE